MENIEIILNFVKEADVNSILILMIIFQGYIIYKQGKLTVDVFNLKDSKIEKLIKVTQEQNSIINEFTTKINDIFYILLDKKKDHENDR